MRRTAAIYFDTKLMCQRMGVIFNKNWSWNRVERTHEHLRRIEIAQFQERINQSKEPVDMDAPFKYTEILPRSIKGETTGLVANLILSPKDLVKHGDEMHHCVGGYYRQCVQNKYIVYEVVDKVTKIKSTIGIYFNKQTGKFVIEQHYGTRNSFIDDSHKEIGKKVVDILNQQAKLDAVKQLFNPNKETEK